MENKINADRFSSTGRFTERKSYLEKNPDAKLQDDCTDVVEYINGHIIQLLKSGTFYVDQSFMSKSLDEAETNLFLKKY